uniref:BAR domain-containing protein n=1 Tax=Syphacia muris TaxID=451379 RepID=A0A0N5A8R1_9BILA
MSSHTQGEYSKPWTTRGTSHIGRGLSAVRKLALECSSQLCALHDEANVAGTSQDGLQMRRNLHLCSRTCVGACEAAKNAIVPHLRQEGGDFTRQASYFICCASEMVKEMRRCETLENSFPLGDRAINFEQIAQVEEMLETLENLITVHFNTLGSSPTQRVAPRPRRLANCRVSCACTKLKTSYA